MFCCSRTLNTRINRIQERGLRIVYSDYTSSFEDLLKKDGSVCVHHRNIQHVAITMFKAKYNLCSNSMKNLFKINSNPYDHKKITFIIPRVNRETWGNLSLRWFGPVVWENMLPNMYKEIVELEKFEEAVKKWVPEECPCRLCKHFEYGVGFLETFE